MSRPGESLPAYWRRQFRYIAFSKSGRAIAALVIAGTLLRFVAVALEQPAGGIVGDLGLFLVIAALFILVVKFLTFLGEEMDAAEPNRKTAKKRSHHAAEDRP